MIIKVNNIFKSFADKVVLNDVSLEVNENETLTIIGPSGCGKSTLLRLIIALQQPDRGTILVHGRDVTTASQLELQKIRSKFGFVFQSAALFDSMSVFDNVAFGLREVGAKSESLIERIVYERLEWVGLASSAELFRASLSGGMKKRVGIARALAVNPEIMLFDEPTTGLDPQVSQNIEELIIRLKNDFNITSIVVTHQISTIKRVSDRIVFLNNAKCENVGTVDDLLHAPERSAQLKSFIAAGMV